jgi:hypothetical protein
VADAESAVTIAWDNGLLFKVFVQNPQTKELVEMEFGLSLRESRELLTFIVEQLEVGCVS